VADINEVADLVTTGADTMVKSRMEQKRKRDVLSEGEESEQEGDTSKLEAVMDTDLLSQTTANGSLPGRLRLTSKVKTGRSIYNEIDSPLPQTAVGVIETHPTNWKKVKLEGVENGNRTHMLTEMDCTDLGEQPVASTSKSLAIARQGHGVASRRSRKAAKGSAVVTKATKADLPPLMLDDINDKWTTVVLPCLILWYGDQDNVWSIQEADLSHVLVAIVQVVYPTYDKINEIQYSNPLYSLVRTIIHIIRHFRVNAVGRFPGPSAPWPLAQHNCKCCSQHSRQLFDRENGSKEHDGPGIHHLCAPGPRIRLQRLQTW